MSTVFAPLVSIDKSIDQKRRRKDTEKKIGKKKRIQAREWDCILVSTKIPIWGFFTS
ncbi:hypothetical protein Syun_031815 [Stephania yunnanensis]|uniref:Uncharacterized protein n=1 Tax=Stephania yunnanensis TaxID=152371 RepID=A0AAP0E4B7_9MAGN